MKGQAWRWAFFIVPIIIIVFVGTKYYMEYPVPSAMKGSELSEPLKTILITLGLPKEWLYTPGIFYLFLIPLIGIFSIVYGFLRELNIFRAVRNINWILALAIAVSTIPLGVFVKFVSTVFASIGVYSTLAFAFLFFAGIGWVIIQRLTGWGWIGGGGTYRGLILENRFNRLRNWLLDADRLNASVQQVRRIPAMLNRADRDWAAGRHDDAVRRLENDVTDVRGDLTRNGLNVPPGP